MNELFSNQRTDDDSGDGERDPGVLGQLPKTRPARRSPRRKAAPAQTRTAPPAARATSARATPAPPAPRATPEAERGLIEEVARTGVSVALGAAEASFAIAGKALVALRRR